jgi:hypothetical protein
VTKKKSPNSKKKSFNLDQASPIEYRDQDQFFDFLKRAQDQEELTGIPADAASPRSTDIMPLSPKASSGNTSPSNRTVSSGGSPSSRKSKKRRELRENQKNNRYVKKYS